MSSARPATWAHRQDTGRLLLSDKRRAAGTARHAALVPATEARHRMPEGAPCLAKAEGRFHVRRLSLHRPWPLTSSCCAAWKTAHAWRGPCVHALWPCRSSRSGSRVDKGGSPPEGRRTRVAAPVGQTRGYLRHSRQPTSGAIVRAVWSVFKEATCRHDDSDKGAVRIGLALHVTSPARPPAQPQPQPRTAARPAPASTPSRQPDGRCQKRRATGTRACRTTRPVGQPGPAYHR